VESQLAQYIPVLMLIVLAVGFAGAMLALSVAIGKRGRRTPIKDSAYECGMPAVGEGTARPAIPFFLVAMLFILFDIEIVFLYPWAVVYREMLTEQPHMIFGAMLSFLGVLTVGYLYAVKKRAFHWHGKD
jgi:NADH-quinone oxidoreductase subunit A